MRVTYLGTGAAEGVPALFCNCKYCRAAKQRGGREIRSRAQVLYDDLSVDFPPDAFYHAAVLGADTVVYFEGEILGKPKNPTHAIQMLKKLSGKTHSVFTGVCLIGDGFEEQFLAESHVTFYELDGKMIEEYVASGKPLDKAGAYGIQDGFPIVKGYEGSYSNIVGLPVEETRAILKKRRLL